jgi:hypothetical protein
MDGFIFLDKESPLQLPRRGRERKAHRANYKGYESLHRKKDVGF